MHQDLAEVLLDEKAIADRVGHLAEALAVRLSAAVERDEPVVLMPVLRTGAL